MGAKKNRGRPPGSTGPHSATVRKAVFAAIASDAQQTAERIVGAVDNTTSQLEHKAATRRINYWWSKAGIPPRTRDPVKVRTARTAYERVVKADEERRVHPSGSSTRLEAEITFTLALLSAMSADADAGIMNVPAWDTPSLDGTTIAYTYLLDRARALEGQLAAAKRAELERDWNSLSDRQRADRTTDAYDLEPLYEGGAPRDFDETIGVERPPKRRHPRLD